MTRVMIIGNAGGGKSRLARRIAEVHGLPLTEMDRLLWQPGWVRAPDSDVLAAHDEVLSGDRWLIDGFGPWSTIEQRLDAADTVILIDHAFHVHLWWAVKRQVRSMIAGRSDGPAGCPMWRKTISLFRMMWWVHRRMRPQIKAAIVKHGAQFRTIHIRSPEDLNAFLAHPV